MYGMPGLTEEEYTRGWDDLRSRMNRKDVTMKFLQSETLVSSTIGYGNINKVLSVGPGEGDLDLAFLSLCPAVEQYTGVEPNTSRCEQLRAALNTQFPNLEVNTLEKGFQDFNAEDNSYDLVLFLHSLHFLMDNPTPPIEQALSLVKPGGKVVIMVAHTVSYKCNADKQEPDGDFPNQVGQILHNTGKEVHSVEVPPFTIDLANRGVGFYDFLEIVARRRLSQDERNKELEKLHEKLIPGTTKTGIKETMYIITK